MGEGELVLGVGVGVGVCITLLVVAGVAVRHSNCGRNRGAARQTIVMTDLCR